MNFFFLLKKKDISSSLNIPTFQNNGKLSNELNLYRARIIEEKWDIQNTLKKKDKNFYKINSSEYNDDDIFFLAEKKNFHNKDLTNALQNINNFTENGFNKDTDRVMVCGGPDMNYQCRDFFEKIGFVEGNLGEAGDFVLERAFVD